MRRIDSSQMSQFTGNRGDSKLDGEERANASTRLRSGGANRCQQKTLARKRSGPGRKRAVERSDCGTPKHQGQIERAAKGLSSVALPYEGRRWREGARFDDVADRRGDRFSTATECALPEGCNVRRGKGAAGLRRAGERGRGGTEDKDRCQRIS